MLARALIHVALFTAVFAACAFVAAHARAEPELTLEWREPAGCPDRAGVIDRVERQLARPLAEASRTLSAVARITAERDGYALTLRTERAGESGVRSFRAASCAELADAAALVLVLSLGADEREATQAPPDPDPRTESEARAPPLRVLLRAGGMGEYGYLPRIGAGAELGLALRMARQRLELTALWLPPVHSARRDGARVAVDLWAARAGYCHDLFRRGAALLACTAVEVGRALGRGVDLDESSSEHFVWFAPSLSLRFSADLHRRLALYVDASASVPVVRRRFVSSDADGRRRDVLHTPRALSARLALGLEVSF